MMMRSFRPLRQLFRAFSAQVDQPQTTSIREKEVPLHLRPYNPLKYEVPPKKLKVDTGYAFLDVEPIPRARIMKIGYLLLDQLKTLKEGSFKRLYFEEKYKYIMEIVDQNDDIETIETMIGKPLSRCSPPLKSCS